MRMTNAILTNIQVEQAQEVITPSDDIQDSDIVASIKQGNLEAYGSIMRRYNQKIFRVARSFVRNDSIAMDIVQESHIKAFSKISEFKGNSSFLVWLYAITRNEALMHLRKHKMERAMNVIDINSLEYLETNQDQDLYKKNEQSLPDKILENIELKELINGYVDELPEDFRIVFVLRAVELLSVRNTAEILLIKEETVKTRHFRAKKILREKIQNYLDEVGMKVYEFGGEHCDVIVHNVMSMIRSSQIKS